MNVAIIIQSIAKALTILGFIRPGSLVMESPFLLLWNERNDIL